MIIMMVMMVIIIMITIIMMIIIIIIMMNNHIYLAIAGADIKSGIPIPLVYFTIPVKIRTILMVIKQMIDIKVII
jgi:hypothetical protein